MNASGICSLPLQVTVDGITLLSEVTIATVDGALLRPPVVSTAMILSVIFLSFEFFKYFFLGRCFATLLMTHLLVG